MKVVHLSTTDYGGAYKAAARISEAMNMCGVESTLLIRTKTREDTIGEEFFSSGLQKFISKVKNVGNLCLSKGEIISDYFGTNVSKHPKIKEADVIILHWVNSFVGYHNVEQLSKLGKPIIWVMHDMWPITGGCHCSYECNKYMDGCEHCPRIKCSFGKIANKNYKIKEKIFTKSNIIFVGPSIWSVNCANKSGIVKQNKIHYIPNCIDNSIFYKRNEMYSKLGIKGEKKKILFGAVKSTDDKNKGINYIQSLVEQLPSDEYCFIIFGKADEHLILAKDMDIYYTGLISDENELAQLYSMADVLVTPSMQESFGLIVAESLSCGTPVVAFDVGGLKDQIKHKENGYLVDIGDVNALIDGIDWCTKKLINKKIDNIVDTSYVYVGMSYIELCRDLLQ